MPDHIGAERMAELLLYQETARFIRGSERMADFERVLRSLGLEMEVIAAAPGSPIVGQTIEAVEARANGAFFIVQINRRDGDAITQPPPGDTDRGRGRDRHCRPRRPGPGAGQSVHGEQFPGQRTVGQVRAAAPTGHALIGRVE